MGKVCKVKLAHTLEDIKLCTPRTSVVLESWTDQLPTGQTSLLEL